jgi:hypothetical protein
MKAIKAKCFYVKNQLFKILPQAQTFLRKQRPTWTGRRKSRKKSKKSRKKSKKIEKNRSHLDFKNKKNFRSTGAVTQGSSHPLEEQNIGFESHQGVSFFLENVAMLWHKLT